MNTELTDYILFLNAIKTTNSPLHSVICTETGRVLCLTNTYRTALVISTIQNTKIWKDVHLTHKLPVEIKPNLPQQFVFDIASQFFTKKALEPDEWYKYVVISEKAACLDQLFRLLPDDSNDYENDEFITSLINVRFDENERIRTKFIRQFLLCDNLKELTSIYEEMNREASVYGNF